MSRWLLALLVGLPLFLSYPGGTTAAIAEPDSTDDAWALIRANTPADRAVYRPTWLPERFRQPAVAATVGLLFGVGYDSDAGDRLFFGVPANFCGGDEGTFEPITVLGHEGSLYTSTVCAPEIWFGWREGDQGHLVMGYKYKGTSAPSNAEMRRIAASLVPVGADGRAQTQAGPPAQECFAATGQCIGGGFLARWRATGGTTINGLPLSGEFRQRLEDGNEYTVQYFERVRLEYHPENPAPYDLLLGQFGRRIHPADPAVAADPQAPRFFPETGHNISGQFIGHWENFGGVSQFGLPISEEITERLEDGKEYRVQYFERARFELHPENQYPYNVLLGQFGRRILAEGSR